MYSSLLRFHALGGVSSVKTLLFYCFTTKFTTKLTKFEILRVTWRHSLLRALPYLGGDIYISK